MPTLNLENLDLTTIDIDSVTNDNKTGVFDKLMVAVSSNINEQYLANNITSNEYANVYLGSLQSALTQSIQFVLQSQAAEAQLLGLLKDNEVKEEQLLAMYTERVIKDKEAAKLGMDNVMKVADNNRKLEDDFVYSPKYIKQNITGQQ